MRFYHWCCIPEPTLHSYEKNFDHPVPDVMMFKRDYKRKQIVIAEIKVHRLIVQDPPHSSPLEHCARAMSDSEYDVFIKGKLNFAEFQDGDYLVRIS